MWVHTLLLLLLGHTATVLSKQTICYYRNWSQYGKGVAKFLPTDIDATLCDIVKYASLRINMETNEVETIKPNDADLLKQLNGLKSQNPNLKIVLAVGGWSHEYKPRYSRMAATPENRETFIRSVVAFLKEHNLDGLSYNWIYPGKRPRGVPASDKEKFTLLLKETLAAFEAEAEQTNTERYYLSATVSPSENQIYKSYELPDIGEYVDTVDVMVTSLWGYWKRTTGTTSAMKGNKINVINSVEAWLNAGMAPNKINIGFALYGRTYNLVNPSAYGLGDKVNGPGRAGPHTRKKGVLAYYEICSREWEHKTEWYDSETKTAYASDTEGLWVAYDDRASLKYKIIYLMQKYNLAGVTLWALAFDDFRGEMCSDGKFPLLNGVNEALDEVSTPTVPPTSVRCKVAVNLGFILDSSGSLKYDYQKEKNFLKAIAASFGITQDGTRAGVITFSYYAQHSVKLSDNFDTYSFNAAVDGIPLMGYTTRIDRALRLAQTDMFSEENGARSGLANVLILLTDGSQSPGKDSEEPGDIADELRAQGILIIAVGIGRSVNMHELTHIGGTANNTFIAPTFEQLLKSDIMEHVKDSSCPKDIREVTGDAVLPSGGMKIATDVVFLMDSSGSVGDDLSKQKQLIKEVMAYCGMGTDMSRGSVISYSRDANIDIKLNDNNNNNDFGAALDDVELMGYWSRMDKAFRLAQTEAFLEVNGGRESVQNVVVMLTDGIQRVYGAEDPSEISALLRREGAKTIAIGMTIDEGQARDLDQISGSTDHTFMANTFEDLVGKDFVESVAKAVCTV